jgi:hypothetical protein
MMKRELLIILIVTFLFIAFTLLFLNVHTPQDFKEGLEIELLPAKKLELIAPAWSEVGEEVTFKVVDGRGDPIENATIVIGDKKLFTDESGKASFIFNRAGDYEIYAFKEGYIALPSVIYQNNGEKEKFVAHIEGNRVIRPSYCGKAPCWGIKNGEIIARGYEEEGKLLTLLPPIWLVENSSLVWRDYSVELDFKINPESKGGFAVWFRFGRFGWYSVGLNYLKNHFLLEKKACRKYYFHDEMFSWETKHILTRDVEISKNWHNLKISVSGEERPKIVVLYDGEKIIEFQDEKHFSPISIGIFAITVAHDTEVMFDNISVKLLQPNESIGVKYIRVYPKGNEKIEFRVLKAALLEIGRRKYGDVRTLGANVVDLRQDIYINPKTFEIVSQPIDDIRAKIIEHMHEQGLKVLYTPAFWWGRNWNKLHGIEVESSRKEILLQKIEEYMIDRAKFAEQAKADFLTVEIPVEIYNENEHTDPVVRKWFEELPWELKKYYNGKILMIVPPTECHGSPMKCEYPGNFSGWDFVSIIIGWDFRTGGDYEIHRLNVKEKLRVVLEKAKEYNKKAFLMLVADLNEEFVREEMEKGREVDEIRAKIFEIDFEEVMKNTDMIAGVFTHPVWEGGNIKCYAKYRFGESPVVLHEKFMLFSYQGPAVEKTIRKYLSLR